MISQAEVFEEIATMDFPFEGIPTVPPRKDMDHMASSFQTLLGSNYQSVGIPTLLKDDSVWGCRASSAGAADTE